MEFLLSGQRSHEGLVILVLPLNTNMETGTSFCLGLGLGT